MVDTIHRFEYVLYCLFQENWEDCKGIGVKGSSKRHS